MFVHEFRPNQEAIETNQSLINRLGNVAIVMSPPWAARFDSGYDSDANISAQHIADATGSTVLGVNERHIRPRLNTIDPRMALAMVLDEAKYQTETIREYIEPEGDRFARIVNFGQSLAGSMAAARAAMDESELLVMHEPLPSHIKGIKLWRGIYEHFGYELNDQQKYRLCDPDTVLPSSPEQVTHKDKLKRTLGLVRAGFEDTFGGGQRMTAPILWPILLDVVTRKPQISIYSEYAILSKALSRRVGFGPAEQQGFLESWFRKLRELQAVSQAEIFYQQGLEVELGNLAFSITPHTTHASYDNTEFRASRIRSVLTELVD